MSLFDLKVINSVLAELEEERGIPREKVIGAIEMSLASAYKKEYGKKGQIIRSEFNTETGDVDFKQIKLVVDETLVRPAPEEGEEEEPEVAEDDERTRFNPEHHIMMEDAKRIKKDAELDSEIEFPLEPQEDFGRIAAQTAKQVIMQRIREAEKGSIMEEYGEREGEIVSGHVQRFERGTLYIDLGRAVGQIAYEDQIPGERYRQGERIRALLYKVDEAARGSFLLLSRAHPQFLVKLFELESPELSSGTVEVKAVAREPGARSKLAVAASDDHIDPVGALVGQRGVRVTTVTSELGGEKIDVIEWSEDPVEFITEALSPAEVLEVELDEENQRANVEVLEDQQSLAIGRGGQNVRLASKLTGWGIDITSVEGEKIAETTEDGDVEVNEDAIAPSETVTATPAETDDDTTATETENAEDTTGKTQEEVAEESAEKDEAPEEQPEDNEEAAEEKNTTAEDAAVSAEGSDVPMEEKTEEKE